MQDDKKIDLDDLESDEFFEEEDLDSEEDLDLDDLEDLDDLDGDWDDDEFSPLKKDAGSVNKVLVYGLIAAFAGVVLFAGYRFVAPMFAGDGQNGIEQSASLPLDDQTAQDVADVESPDLLQEAPPMPLPVNNVVEEDSLLQNSVLPDETAVLTPLPSLESVDEVLPVLLPLAGVEQNLEQAARESVSGVKPDVDLVSVPDPVLSKTEEEVIPPETMVSQELLLPAQDMDSDAPLDMELEQLSDSTVVLDQKMAGIARRLNDHDQVLEKIMKSLARIETELIAQQKSIDAVHKVAKASVAAVPKKSSKKKAARKAAPKKKPILHDKTSSRSSRSTKPKAVTKKSWVLKSAQPGKAVIAEGGTNYLRSVEVGSTLSGIGKITSISNETGRWIVRGTQGRIAQ